MSTTLELDSGDLVSDTHDGATDLLLGIDIGTVLNRLSRGASDRIDRCTARRQMPCVEHVNERLDMASGAALAFKTLNQPNLVLIYVRRGDAVGGSWKRILTLAAKLELPMIFVVLPDREGRKKRARVGHVSARAGSFGVPSIPVDASDAVALYRVAQESIGRVRGGGGPVVVECVALPTKPTFVDPIEQMKDFLLSRNVCTPAWLARAGDGLRDRIARSAKQSRAEE